MEQKKVKTTKILRIVGFILAVVSIFLRISYIAKDINLFNISLYYIILFLGLFILVFSPILAILIVKKQIPDFRRKGFWTRWGIWGVLLLVFLIIVSFYPITQKMISTERSKTFEFLANEHLSWLLNNKLISPQLSDDIHHLKTYLKQVSNTRSPYIKETAKILEEIFSEFKESDYPLSVFKNLYNKYCKDDERSQSLFINQDNILKEFYEDYSYFLSLKGLIAKELANEGINMKMVDNAERYFRTALDYNKKCSIAYNGLGNLNFYQLQQREELDKYSIQLAMRSEENFKNSVNKSEIHSNYSIARRYNNIACIELNIINKIFLSNLLRKNPGLTEFIKKLDENEVQYFKPFESNLVEVFKKNWENLIKAERLCVSVPQMHITFAQFYSLVAEFVFEYIGNDKLKANMICTRIFGLSGFDNLKYLYEKSLERIKTSNHLGGYNLSKYICKKDESLRKYGFGAFVIAKNQTKYLDFYNEFLDICMLNENE